jgi:hypothetical protein
MGTIISKNPIPLTAVFKFFMGSPAKPESRPSGLRSRSSYVCRSFRTPFPVRAAFQRSSEWRVRFFAPGTAKLWPRCFRSG